MLLITNLDLSGEFKFVINNYIHSSLPLRIMRKKLLTLGICAVLICSLILPVTATVISQTDQKYVITPCDTFISARAAPQTGVISQGQTLTYTYTVSHGSSELQIGTSWIVFPFNNALSMEIIRPNGISLGSYTDDYDGTIDGNIPVSIKSSSLEPGVWTIKITGKSVTGLQPFTLTINEL